MNLSIVDFSDFQTLKKIYIYYTGVCIYTHTSQKHFSVCVNSREMLWTDLFRPSGAPCRLTPLRDPEQRQVVDVYVAVWRCPREGEGGAVDRRYTQVAHGGGSCTHRHHTFQSDMFLFPPKNTPLGGACHSRVWPSAVTSADGTPALNVTTLTR